MSYEFKSDSGIHFIKDLNIYNSITLEKVEWGNKKFHRIKLYYYKHYKDYEGFISVERDYDYFDFTNLTEATTVFSDLKKLLESRF